MRPTREIRRKSHAPRPGAYRPSPRRCPRRLRLGISEANALNFAQPATPRSLVLGGIVRRAVNSVGHTIAIAVTLVPMPRLQLPFVVVLGPCRLRIGVARAIALPMAGLPHVLVVLRVPISRRPLVASTRRRHRFDARRGRRAVLKYTATAALAVMGTEMLASDAAHSATNKDLRNFILSSFVTVDWLWLATDTSNDAECAVARVATIAARKAHRLFATPPTMVSAPIRRAPR